MFKIQPDAENHDPLPTHIIELLPSIGCRPLRPVAEVAQLAGNGAPRRLAGEVGMLLAIVGTLFSIAALSITNGCHCAGAGRHHRVPLGNVQMTAVPQRTRSATLSARCASRWSAPRISSPRAQHHALHDVGTVAGVIWAG